MEHFFTYQTSSDEEGMTIEAYLKSKRYSRKLISHLRQTENGLTIDGNLVYTTHRLLAGESLLVRITEDTYSENILPTPMPISIVYEDDDLLILNKQSDTPVHPSLGNYENTLANGLMHYFLSKGEQLTFRTINRLDRDTTGLLIVAKHLLSASILYDMASKRELHRTYLAVVTGELKGSGTIDAPIARTADSIISRCVNFEHGERAVTHYEALESRNGYTLVQITLETGRTHQIRVHMNHLGYPLPGDFLYHPDYSVIGRQALHSFGLSFVHPITGKQMEFLSPLPKDMAAIFHA